MKTQYVFCKNYLETFYMKIRKITKSKLFPTIQINITHKIIPFDKTTTYIFLFKLCFSKHTAEFSLHIFFKTFRMLLRKKHLHNFEFDKLAHKINKKISHESAKFRKNHVQKKFSQTVQKLQRQQFQNFASDNLMTSKL